MRFGIIDSIDKKSFPLILDDCFIQYDDFRLKNVLEFLVRLGKDRQIILFTCHKWEVEILNSLAIDFNLVSLN